MSTTSDARCTPSTDEERRRKRPRFPSLQRPPTSLDDDDEGGTSSDSRSSVRLARSRLHDDTTDRRSSEADQPVSCVVSRWSQFMPRVTREPFCKISFPLAVAAIVNPKANTN